jgi:predicted AAA+ superfamily ATPase
MKKILFFNRILDLKPINSSFFLFGPRLTGKTTLLRNTGIKNYFDLLDVDLELKYRHNPKIFWEEISMIPRGEKIVVDEIQKIPQLLNYVQMAIDRYNQQFILSGSSARKLKRGAANLLGGRALDLKLHPLTFQEIGELFNLETGLMYGTIPKIYSLLAEDQTSLAAGHLKSYVTTYIKEEIQAEALTRQLGAFQRFLDIAAQSNAQIVEFANISRESAVAASTVKEYYQILQDTLIGSFLWPFEHKERKKSRPKFYFFDTGVIRALQNRLIDPPNSREKGLLFETWIINELIRIRDYYNKPHQFNFWRYRDHEIDLIISGPGGPIAAIECKSGRSGIPSATIQQFRKKLPKIPIIIASLSDNRPRKLPDVEIYPWRDVLRFYSDL